MVVPSSGQVIATAAARPQAGQRYASFCTPAWWSRSSTRPSDAASSVSAQPAEPSAFLPTSSRQRATASLSKPDAPLVDERLHDVAQLGVGGMSIGARPPDHGLLELGREDVGELGPRLVSCDDDDSRPPECPEEPFELVGDGLVVLEVEIADVALVARLRPATLVVPALGFLGPVGDLLEAAAPEREHAPLLAPDDGDDRAVAPSDQRDERAEQEIVGDAGRVGDLPRQREHAPDVVQAGREHGEPAGAVTIELPVEVLREPLEIRLEAGLDLVREIGTGGAVRARGRVEHRVDAHRRLAGGRRDGRVEVDIERDRAAVLSAKACKFTQPVEADGGCRHIALSA